MKHPISKAARARVTLVHGANSVILDFLYSDLWYPLTDGAGHSLVVVDPEEPQDTWNDLENWRESENPDGTPGWDDSGVLPGGRQRPGDLNQDSTLEIGDVVRLLLLLFRGDAFTPPCDGNTVAEGGNVTLADFNGDAAVDSADAVAILQYLFQNGPAHASGELCVRIESCPRTCGL